jgi:general secretion pathway protein B
VSYILDALRKAERDRQVSRVPTLATAHGGAELLRRPHWAWAVAAGAVALSAVVTYSLPWAPARPDPVREAALPPPAADHPAASRASADPETPPPALERALEGLAAGPALTPGPAVERPPGGRAPARPRVVPPAKTTRTARAGDDLRRAPDRRDSPEAPPARRATAAEARPTPPAVVDRAPASELRPGGAPVAQPAVAPAPAPLPDAGAGRAAQPAPSQTLARLTLDVLVYSEVPAERLVFINGRKYVEGQTLDGETVVEQITSDGAILQYQGKRIVLRPKLNPYARPGSP